MYNKIQSLTVTYRNSFIRFNEKDGSSYRVYCYLVDTHDPDNQESNSEGNIAQLAADIAAAGYNVLKDDETGQIVYKSHNPVPPGCPILRVIDKKSGKAKWIADTAMLDMQEALAKRYPHLYGRQQQQQPVRRQQPVQQQAPANDSDNIDPFA